MRRPAPPTSLIANEMSSIGQWVRRLFTEFPSGPAAAGLLLLRCVVGLVLLLRPSDRDVLTAVVGILMMVGLVTPVAAFGAVAVLAVSRYSSGPSDFPDVNFLLLIAGCVSLALLGPGAWSLDARIFGRREIVIPHRRL
jgi:hypothetical protein